MNRWFVITAAVAAFASSTARAEEDARRFHVAPFVGAYVPTGDQRDLLEDAVSAGLTASYEVHPYVAVLASFAWAPTKVKALALHDDLDLFQYDLGLEGHYPFPVAVGWSLQPFLGLGAGARTYRFRNLDVSSQTDFAGYVSAGLGLERGPFALRLSVRDYVSAFDGLTGGESSTARNDLSMVIGAGMRF